MHKKQITKYVIWGSGGLFVYMPFHIFLSQWLSSLTGGLEIWKLWKDVATLLVTLLCVVTVFIYKKYTKSYVWLLVLTAMYGLLHISLLFTNDRPLSLGLLASVYNIRLFAYVIIGFSLGLLLPKNNMVRRFTKLLLICSTIVCLVAIVQWLLPKDLMTHFGYSVDRGVKPNFFIDDKPDFPRVFSTLRDPNSLGAFLILPITLLVQQLLKYWNSNKRLLLSGLVLIHVLTLMLTFSRSTLLATIVAISALVILQNKSFIKRYKRPIAVYMIIAVLSIGTGFVAFKDTYFVKNTVFHADEKTVLADPNELRVDLFQKGIEGVASDPLGNGPGTAGLVSTRAPGGLLTENYFLQIAYEVGVEGFLVFVVLLAFIVNELWKRRQSPIAIALIASFVGLVLANLLFHTWANEAVAIAFFMLAGLTITTAEESSAAG